MKYRSISFLVLALAAWGCATEPEPLDKSQPDAVNKQMFDGDWYYKLTVVDSEWYNDATFIGEESFFGSAKIRWEITEDKLNAYMVPQKYCPKKEGECRADELVENKIGMQAMVLSFAIKDHFDIKYQENTTTREELNVIIENNTDRPWWERDYMRVDWSESLVTNVWAPMSGALMQSDLVREPVSVKENVEFFDSTEAKIDTRGWKPGSDPDVVAMNIDTKESIRESCSIYSYCDYEIYLGNFQPAVTVKWRHSLLKAKDRNYVAMDFRDDFFRRFGYFRTEYQVFDDERAVRESDAKYFINRWNLADGRKVVWHLSPSFPRNDQDLMDWTQDVVDTWNKAFQEATGRQDDVVVLVRENPILTDEAGNEIRNADGSLRYKYELGDIRYSFINYTTRPNNSSPLGYGPSYADPDTGEIISAAVNVYGNWVEYVVTRAMDLFDLMAGNCTVEDVARGHYFNEQTGLCNGGVPDGDLRSDLARPDQVVVKAGQVETEEALNFMTPTQLSMHWPKSDIQAPSPKIQLGEAKFQERLTQLTHLMRMAGQEKIPLDLSVLSSIRGTGLEQMLMPHSSIHGALPGVSSAEHPHAVAAFSPANRLSSQAFEEIQYNEYLNSVRCRIEHDHYDHAVLAFVQKNKDQPRDKVKREVRRWIYFNTTLHEMGHTVGLRHNFRGSADRVNFIPQYEDAWVQWWDTLDALRAEYKERIDAGDAEAYREYVNKARFLASERSRFSGTSIMDYTGDWELWATEPDSDTNVLPSFDRAAILFGYGEYDPSVRKPKVEIIDEDKIADLKFQEENGRINYGSWPWKVVGMEPEDLTAKHRWEPLSGLAMSETQSKRLVRHYQFCSDEKVFDDAFCTRFDSGVTATEITQNFINDQYRAYFFRNFKRDNALFDEARGGYFIRKWLYTYYMMAKPLPQMVVNQLWYGNRTTDALYANATWEKVLTVPEDRFLVSGIVPEGAEDLLRATLLAYHYFLYDVLMRPDYGDHAQAYDRDGNLYWESTDEPPDILDPQPRFNVKLGQGWGWSEKWDSQPDALIDDATGTYYEHLIRIGVELDKIAVLEVMSIPAALNGPLYHEKANGLSFWNSVFTGFGHEMWEVMRGMVTDNFTHLSNPWCATNGGSLTAYPVNMARGLLVSGLVDGEGVAGDPATPSWCPEGSAPVKPGMDALFAIYPIFWSIAGPSHPWYENAYAERLDSQVKGGDHRFDIPAGAEVAQFTNTMGTKTWQAVNTSDGLSISFPLVRQAEGIMNRFAFLDACMADQEPQQGYGTNNRTCEDVFRRCGAYRPADWCAGEGWLNAMDYLDYPAGIKYRDVDRIEAMLIMAQDMVDIAGHKMWRVPGVLDEP